MTGQLNVEEMPITTWFNSSTYVLKFVFPGKLRFFEPMMLTQQLFTVTSHAAVGYKVTHHTDPLSQF